MCCSIHSVEISQYTIIDPLDAFKLAKNIIQENSNSGIKRGVRTYEVNHTKNIYRYVSLPNYRGKLEKEEYEPGINVFWTVPTCFFIKAKQKPSIINNSSGEEEVLESKSVLKQ